jgi:hypothetical protein
VALSAGPAIEVSWWPSVGGDPRQDHGVGRPGATAFQQSLNMSHAPAQKTQPDQHRPLPDKAARQKTTKDPTPHEHTATEAPARPDHGPTKAAHQTDQSRPDHMPMITNTAPGHRATVHNRDAMDVRSCRVSGTCSGDFTHGLARGPQPEAGEGGQAPAGRYGSLRRRTAAERHRRGRVVAGPGAQRAARRDPVIMQAVTPHASTVRLT